MSKVEKLGRKKDTFLKTTYKMKPNCLAFMNHKRTTEKLYVGFFQFRSQFREIRVQSWPNFDQFLKVFANFCVGGTCRTKMNTGKLISEKF